MTFLHNQFNFKPRECKIFYIPKHIAGPNNHQTVDRIISGVGAFFYVKMPGYRLPGLAAATTLHFTACPIQHPLSQEPTASFAFPGGISHLLIKSTGAIILS